MQWLTKLMYGRYGTDALGFFMLILVLILDVIFTFLLGYPVSLFLPACCMVYLAYLFQKHQPPVRRKPEIYAGIFSGTEHDCFQNLRGKRPENTSAFSLSILQTENSCSTRKRKNPDYLPKMRTGIYQKILRTDYLSL